MQYQILSLSGGKDSTAMLLKMLEHGESIQEVIYVDTGMEFPEVSEHLDRLERYTGVPISRIKAPLDFEYYLCEVPRPRISLPLKGYGFPNIHCRWCTTYLKTDPFKKYVEKKYPNLQICKCIGIALDEQKRVDHKLLKSGKVRYPLIDYGLTEAEALQLCYDHGFDFGGLYKHRSRLSCWCCPLQSIGDLRALYRYHPKLWQRLKELQKMSHNPFKVNYTLDALERAFKIELEQESDKSLVESCSNDPRQLIIKELN